MVAGILGLLLELFATRLLVEKVSGDLAEKLVGRGLPPELQAYIRSIVDTDIVRDHYIKEYKLSLLDGGKKVQLDVTVSFDVRNYSDTVIEYTPIYQDEVFYDPKFMSLEYGLIGQKKLTETVDETDPITKVLTVGGKRKIKLQPFRRDEKAVCQVVMRYRLKMPSDYSDIINFAAATIGATIRVESLPPELDFVSGGYTTLSDLPSGDKSWYFDRPFVTGQNIRVWWFKKALS